MRRAFAISFATISVVAFACDEFSESETPAPDAGTGETSTTIDAANDVAITDGGIDATPPVPFCSTVDASIRLCWSFDDPSTSALYGTAFSPKGDEVSLTQLAKSAPNAMRASRDGSSGASMITLNATGAVNALACTMAVFIEDITDSTELLTFGLGPRVAAFLVTPLGPGVVKTALLYDRVGPKTIAGPNLATGKWVTITLAGQRTGNGFLLATSTEYGDGGTATGTFPDAGENIFAMTPSIDIGFFVPYDGTGAVRVDDILCDWN